MAVSDSLALSSILVPRPPTKEQQQRARLLERGADLRPCPECGEEAEHEPTCLTVKGGKHLRVTVIRCPQCKVLTRSEEIATPDPEPEMAEVALDVSYSRALDLVEDPDIHREEPAPVPDVKLCECGCGTEPRPGRRFASRSCSNRINAVKMSAKVAELRAAGVQVGGRKKSSPVPSAEVHAPTLPDRPLAGAGGHQDAPLVEMAPPCEHPGAKPVQWTRCKGCNGSGIVAGRNEYETDKCSECSGRGGWLSQHDYLTSEQREARAVTPPPVADLEDSRTWRPGAVVPMSAEQMAFLEDVSRTRRVPSGLEQAKAYLRKLTPEGRQALLGLVEAEERCEIAGVR